MAKEVDRAIQALLGAERGEAKERERQIDDLMRQRVDGGAASTGLPGGSSALSPARH
ncbi:MAG: hypothetical protein ACREUG_08020 [Steroidobacteraceae bacterium]